LKISLRAVQKKLANLRDKSVGGKNANADGRGQSAQPETEKGLYKHGYQAAKSELQAQLKTAAEKESALAVHIADLEKENEKLQGIARQLQEQPGKGEAKAVSKPRPHADALKEFVGLAAEAFRIINGKYGERLMGNADGNRLVEIAKKAAAMKAKVKVC
jgi:regulator of replication initiation timing